MFALGMNNNGTGLVLASMALADHPRVMLPIIFYNMVQHLVAGAANAMVNRAGPAPDAEISPVAGRSPPSRSSGAEPSRPPAERIH